MPLPTSLWQGHRRIEAIMFVKQNYDGTFTIVGMTYATLEDLISAFDSSLFPPSDLYDEQDQIQPLREALASSQRTFGDLTG